MIRVSKVIPLEANCLRVTFSDGKTGVCDLSDLIKGPQFAPLAENTFFNHVAIREDGAIFWLNGADICPELLYRMAKTEPV